MSTQAQRGTHDDLIEDRGRGVDDEVAATRRADDAAQVSRVHPGDGDGAALAQEAAPTFGIAVTAPDRMSLTLQQLCE